MSNTQTIWNFFASKHLSAAAIAGIMANIQLESSFNPGASNSGEGAIGIGQWEGGRRTALQQFAASRGSNEQDLQTQLDFMWSELNGPEKAVLDTIKYLPDAASVASEFDQQYERSAGTQRDAKIAAAQTIFGLGAHGIGTYQGGGTTTNSAGATQLSTGGSAGATGGGAAAVTRLSAADYQTALGDLSGLLRTVPELAHLVHQGLTDPKGQWTAETFLQKIHQSNWWHTHSDNARTLTGLKLSDPAQYKVQANAAVRAVEQEGHQLGINLNVHQVSELSHQMLWNQWDQTELQRQIGLRYTGKGVAQGQAATYQEQLRQMYADYGVPVSAGTMGYRVRQLLEGATTADTYKEAAIASAKSMYPSLAGQLAGGMTVKDIADPYIQTMSNMLELDPATISVTDPMVKRALQGSIVTTGGKSTATTTTLYDFEKQLRSDPRWGKTQNAKDTMSTALTTIGKDWGFQ